MLLGDHEACDVDPRHQRVRLDDPRGREDLAQKVWSAPQQPLLVSPESHLMFSSAGTGLLAALGVAAGPAGMVAAMTVGPLAMLGAGVLASRRARRTQPFGAAGYLRPVEQPQFGRVVGPAELIAPLSGRRCIGYVVTLRSRDFYGGDTMLTDAITAGFELQASGGRRVRVPPGRMRFQSHASRSVRNREAVDRFVGGINEWLLDHSPDHRGPVPFDYAEEGLLREGDMVEVHGQVSVVGLSYRHTSNEYEARGVPHVRLVRTAAEDAVAAQAVFTRASA